MDFDELREAVKEPAYNAIVKVELFDGVEIDLYEGSFQPLAIAPDPENNNTVTLWYTRAVDLNQPTTTVQIRLFMEGQATTPRLHHYVGYYKFDRGIRFVYLDRTRDHRIQQAEMRSVLRQATGDISRFVEEFLSTADENPDMDKNDFLRNLLKNIDFDEEDKA